MDPDLPAREGQWARTNILMPPFDGTIAKWFKQEGDSIQREELLCEILTNTRHFQFPSPVGGTILKITSPGGSKVRFDTVIAVVEVRLEECRLVGSTGMVLDVEDERLQALGYKVPPDLTWLDQEIRKLEHDRDEAISIQEFERAAQSYDKAQMLTRQKLRWTATRVEKK